MPPEFERGLTLLQSFAFVFTKNSGKKKKKVSTCSSPPKYLGMYCNIKDSVIGPWVDVPNVF